MTLAELRDACAGAVAGVGSPALVGYAYVPDDPVTPCVVFEPEEVDWRKPAQSTFRRGGDVWTLSGFVLITPADAQNARRQVDEFFDRSAADLKDKLEAIAGVEVTGADRFGEYPVAGAMLSGFRLVIEANT